MFSAPYELMCHIRAKWAPQHHRCCPSVVVKVLYTWCYGYQAQFSSCTGLFAPLINDMWHSQKKVAVICRVIGLKMNYQNHKESVSWSKDHLKIKIENKLGLSYAKLRAGLNLSLIWLTKMGWICQFSLWIGFWCFDFVVFKVWLGKFCSVWYVCFGMFGLVW